MTPPNPQQAVFEFLSDAATFGVTEPVERIETHISAVFLAGNRAWKLKKAVTLPFLDFSTLAAREKFCRLELELNRRIAPKLYLGLHRISRGEDGGLTLDGDGEIVDYVIEMVRFDQSSLFDRQLAAGTLTRHRLEELAEDIARFHGAAEIIDDPELGGATGLRSTVTVNDVTYRKFLDLFGTEKVDVLLAKSYAAIDAHHDLLESRRDNGRVLRCHGDLHLRNICMIDDRPTIFDAIEFSEIFACIDVFYDLAFLLMDLDFRGASLESNIILNRYLDVTGDIAGLAALPVMLATRASVRAFIGATTAAGMPPDQAGPVQQEAVRYLDAALDYLKPGSPRLIAVGGLSGSGKSRLARVLGPEVAPPPGTVVLRSDAIRKRLLGVGPRDRLGPEGYEKGVSVEVYDTIRRDAATALAAGFTVIADAVYARPGERDGAAAVAAACGVPFTGLWAEAPVEVMAERVTKRQKNVSDADERVLRLQLDYDPGDISWSRLDTSGPREATLASALRVLGI